MNPQPTPPFSREDAARMVAHMNDDHPDSVLAYVRHFARRPDASAATLLDVTPDALHIRVEAPGETAELTLPFDRRLESSHDAHMTMVRMSKQAKRALAGTHP